MKKMLGVLAMLAAAVVAFTAPAMADSTFTGKDQVCLYGERAGDIASQQGALVLLADNEGRIKLLLKNGYDEMLDPPAAVAGGLSSFREVFAQPTSPASDSGEVVLVGHSTWKFSLNSHAMRVIAPRGSGKGYGDCASNLEGAARVFDLKANRAVVR